MGSLCPHRQPPPDPTPAPGATPDPAGRPPDGRRGLRTRPCSSEPGWRSGWACSAWSGCRWPAGCAARCTSSSRRCWWGGVGVAGRHRDVAGPARRDGPAARRHRRHDPGHPGPGVQRDHADRLRHVLERAVGVFQLSQRGQHADRAAGLPAPVQPDHRQRDPVPAARRLIPRTQPGRTSGTADRNEPVRRRRGRGPRPRDPGRCGDRRRRRSRRPRPAPGTRPRRPRRPGPGCPRWPAGIPIRPACAAA